MKKRYTAAMLVAAMLMMNPKLPIRASHAHAEGEEEQANEANSSEQPGAQEEMVSSEPVNVEPQPEPEPQSEPEPQPEPEPEPDPVIEAIRADVLAEAPVQAGGGYVLEFLYHNSGWLYITPAPDAAPVTGSFNKEPDKPDQLRFFYEDADYTYAVSYYSEEGKSLTLLTVDLTAKYQALYPTAGITKVERLEYTTHPF